jgi:ankyrin repeat protein
VNIANVFVFVNEGTDVASAHRRLSQKELRLHMVQSIERHDLPSVQRLLNEGIDLNCVILFNKTPLTYALELHEFNIAKRLVKAGADVNAREPIANSRQPLHLAMDTPNLDIIQYLLGHGAQVDGQDGCGATPLMLASHRGHLQVVRLLLAHGANLLEKDYVGRTALHRAAEGQHDDVVRFLVTSRADVCAQDRYGWTAIYHSIVFCHLATARALVECGVPVNTLDCNSRSPLVLACHRLSPSNIKVRVLSPSQSIRYYGS